MSAATIAAILASLPSPESSAPLRRLGSADLPALLELYRRRAAWMAARGIDQWRGTDAAQMAELFARRFGTDAVLGVDGTDGLLGAVILAAESPLWTAHPHPYGEPVVHLEKLMTDPAAPSGTGAALLGSAEQLLAQQGCALLRMDCLTASRPLRRFWQTRHYVPVDEADHASGHRVLLHEKRLLPAPASEVPIAFPDDVLERPFEGVRATLLFVVQPGRVLLMHKKRGLGAGKINGPGGKCEPGETPRACAIRETAEELCIDVAEPEYRGELRYLDTSFEPIHGFVYVSRDFTGTPTETDEARPEWFPLDAIPYGRMWADDRMWLPWVLEGESMRAAFLGHEDRIEAARLVLGPTPEPRT
jgi:8-oxo-dGTP diphosphatase